MPQPTEYWNNQRAAVAARDCPRCGRLKDQPCKNLRTATWKEEVDLVFAHKERHERQPEG